MPSESTADERTGLSRRQVLARGAVAAGVVWAAPVIRATAAYATTNHGTEQPCHTFFLVSINPAGKCKKPGADAHGSGAVTNAEDLRAYNSRGGHLPPAIEQWLSEHPRITVQFPSVCPQLTQTSDEAWALLLPEVTGPNAAGRQCRMVLGWGRKGNDYAEAYVDPNPPLPGQAGRRLIFPKPEVVVDHNGKPRTNTNGVTGDGSPTEGSTPTSTTTTTTTTPPSTIAKPRAAHSALDDAVARAEADLAAGGNASRTTTTTTPGASGGELGGDGTTSDGTETLTGDGTPSTSTSGPGRTLDEAVLVYCCP